MTKFLYFNSMEKLKLKHITLMDEVETNEARKIFTEHQRKYSPLIVVPLIVSIVTLLLGLLLPTPELATMTSILLKIALAAFVLTFIGAAIYSAKMKPYLKLLKIAKLNDRIRHTERIREKERQRLANPANKDKKYTVDDIDTTLPDAD